MNNEEKKAAKKQAVRKKLIRKITLKQQKNIQPGECMKFIEVNINDDIEKSFDFYQETVTMLESASVAYSLKSSLLIPDNSITWTKIIEEYFISDDNKINTTIKKVKGMHALIILKWDQVVKEIYNKTFTKLMRSIADLMPQMKLSVVIYSIERYFEYYKRTASLKDKNSYPNDEMIGIPKISIKDFELSLIDLQLDMNINVRLIENSADMSLLIYQYTKAIAETTYKSEIKNKLCDQIEFFAAGDNKKTIKVDDNGYGLKKLWLKQLCMFNTSSLATADAICSMYSSPNELITAYENCSCVEDRDVLLKDIHIKRAAAGVLTKVRKLGPELSRKIHIMYMSTNGDQLLN